MLKRQEKWVSYLQRSSNDSKFLNINYDSQKIIERHFTMQKENNSQSKKPMIVFTITVTYRTVSLP